MKPYLIEYSFELEGWVTYDLGDDGETLYRATEPLETEQQALTAYRAERRLRSHPRASGEIEYTDPSQPIVYH